MPEPLLSGALKRVPGLSRMPIAKLIALGELVLLAREHITRLERTERRRFLELMRHARGRRRNLSPDEQAELAALVAKANPRLVLGLAADKLSPIPLPRRIVHGKRGARRGRHS